NLQGLTDHLSRLETTIADLQQTAVAQDAAIMQGQETANTFPIEKITQLIDVPVANLQQGVDQRFMDFGNRITRLEAAVNELQQSAQLAKQKSTSETNANSLFSQGNQNEINILTKRLSEIESSLQIQATKLSNNKLAQTLRQKELQQKILNGNKVAANEASDALSQGNQQHIRSLSHRIEEVESSLQKYATDISHNKVMVENTASTKSDNNASTNTGSDRVLIEKDSSGVTITLNKPVTAEGKQENVNNKYQMITHIVVKNDTLWSIAKRYVKNPYLYHELAKLSNIKNPDLIYPGNRVRIIQFTD
ncbi:MAG: LysM peptidoglycan-binding domain-containing protein, partial [Gammaproteobacteria bacterium]|nr:LysM peptidoglycan-binding domain-containing protein [Gammaproteobacteria bacterium]